MRKRLLSFEQSKRTHVWLYVVARIRINNTYNM